MPQNVQNIHELYMVLSFCDLEQLPTEVQNIMSLVQYLDLSGNPLKQLPKTICNWYSLRSLDVSFCYLLLCLPTWIGELQRLQHLRVNHTTNELHNLPKRFEKLTLIRTMDFFSIGSGKYKSNVHKLRHLNSLEELRLAVHGEVDFSGADLKSKTAMVNLELCFTGEGRDQDKVSSIMRKFKPPPKLEMLMLKDYPGLRLPRWIQAKSLVDKLKRLSLRTIVNITSLPTLWKLSSLEFLWLYGLPNIKHLGRDFFGIPKTRGKQRDDQDEDEDEVLIPVMHLCRDFFRIPKTRGKQRDDQDEDVGDYGVDNEDISDYSDDDVKLVIPPITEKPTTTFLHLKTLRIEYLKNWESWEDSNEAEKFSITVMPCLEELITDHCPKLDGKLPLNILRDTPWWFKANNPKEVKEYVEANQEGNTMKPPSQKNCAYNMYELYKMEANEKNAMKPPDNKNELPKKEANEKINMKPPFYSASRPGNIFELYKMEANETNTMKPPREKKCVSAFPDNKNEEINASYIKLREFVRDGSTNPSQNLKVSVPEGDLGNTRVTYYLPLDALHDWFENDHSMFAEQLFVWSKIIYELMTPSDKERVQIANSALITTIGTQGQPGIRSDDLVDFMIKNRAKLYLVPLLRPGHWELLAIVPETGVIYRFDSLQGSISPEHTEFFDMIERKYATRILNSTGSHNSWKVVDIKHKKQAGSWECGYYVIIWMQKIALEIQGLRLESHFPTDESPYEPDMLSEVDWKWCQHVISWKIQVTDGDFSDQDR